MVAYIRERPDRVIGSVGWCNFIPRMGVRNLNILSSNHAPIMLDTYMEHGHLPKPFRFFEVWSFNPSCRDVIAKAWEKVVSGVESFKLRVRLGNLRLALRSWNRFHIGNCSIILRDMKARLRRLQSIPYSPYSFQRRG